MSALHIFLLSMAGCILFSAGLYIEQLTRPQGADEPRQGGRPSPWL